MFTPAFVQFLFTLALTALVVRSLVRYAQTPDKNKSVRSSTSRLVILVIGGLISFSFVMECLRQLRALLN